MNTAEYTFSPEAVSFYERLDVPRDADRSTIDTAGKLAYKQYSEADREEFLRLREARETLTDGDTRRAYDRCCEKLGVERGTEAYNRWESRGARQDVSAVIAEFETAPEPDPEPEPEPDSLRERLRIDDPIVTWSHGKPEGAVNVAVWGDEETRLYINNVHESGDIYLDLDAGQFYTAQHERLSDVDYTVVEGENALTVEYETLKLRIDLAGSDRQNPLRDHVTVDEPAIAQANFTAEELSVNLWKDRRLYINGFRPGEDVYISLDNGRVYKDGRESEPVSGITYDLSPDGKELTLTDGHRRTVVVDLIGRRGGDPHPEPDPTGPTEPIPVNGSALYFPGVLARVTLGSVGQIVALIGIVLGLSAASLPNVVSYPAIFVAGVVLYAGGIVVIGGSGVLALVDGRFGRAGFAAAVAIAAVWYYFGVERLIGE